MPIDANRTITETIEIDASLEEVWQSLVLGEQIARWFSFEATSEARLGGEVNISWGTSWQGSLQITAFEPECHLQWSEAAKPGSWPPWSAHQTAEPSELEGQLG